MKNDPAQEQAWVRQLNFTYGGLLIAGFFLIQPFLTARSLDVSARICVVAFAVAIPLLAALILLGQQEEFKHRLSGSKLVSIARSVGQLAAFVGLTAGFWHMVWFAGVAVLAATVIATGVYSAGYTRVIFDKPPRDLPGYG